MLAKQKGVISNVRDIIEKLHNHNFRFAKPIVEQILKEAGEA
ncbi:DUF3368 domain-containing protein [Fulvivirgaceae bacterium PWU4]|uniref:DUF3368 domain-containing protein n=1 Tax=Chryseosolibacter histidini TaxID=2782349 RepID=A0AAP2DLQ7_9BACT|nr:DUF3368 domain-containing protein [Chryseosolibacter histidini]